MDHKLIGAEGMKAIQKREVHKVRVINPMLY